MGITAVDALVVGGAPLVPGAIRDLVRQPIPGCKVFYVGATASAQVPGGQTFATLGGTTGALAALTGRLNKGDIIYLLPGHTESLSAADFFSDTGAASGFSVIGLGMGPQRPQLTWTVAAATWLLDTAGVEIANCQLYLAGPSATGALTVAAPITVSATGCRMIGNYITWGWDADSIVGTGIIVGAADFTFIQNTCIAASAAVPTETFMRLTAADRAQIFGNYIVGPTAGATVGVIKGLTTASVNINVVANYLESLTGSSTIAFSPLAASTGTCRLNHFQVVSGILPVTASLLNLFENWCNNTAGKTGAKVGTAST